MSQNRVALSDKQKYDNVDYIMAWIDTSGSMSQEDLDFALTQMYMVANAKKPVKLLVVQFDTRVTDIVEIDGQRDIKREFSKLKIKGRGGTDVKCCFDLLTDRKSKYSRVKPELIAIFTDGYLEQYKRNARTMQHLLWVVQGNDAFELQYKDANTMLIRK